MKRLLLAAALALSAQAAAADEVSLRLGGKELPLSPAVRERLATFGAEQRWQRLLEGSRLRVRFAEPFVTESHLGGTRGVSEALIGLEHEQLFVGPDFTRHGTAIVEHLQCGYLPSLELACLAELQPHLPARYRETCARLERDAGGRIVMPPPDIAPSCS
jgi:hypothetical protein